MLATVFGAVLAAAGRAGRDGAARGTSGGSGALGARTLGVPALGIDGAGNASDVAGRTTATRAGSRGGSDVIARSPMTIAATPATPAAARSHGTRRDRRPLPRPWTVAIVGTRAR
jgi:hypothetical protein